MFNMNVDSVGWLWDIYIYIGNISDDRIHELCIFQNPE